MEQHSQLFDEEEFRQATLPAIEYLQKHGLARSTILIEWDRAILEFVEMSYAVPAPD